MAGSAVGKIKASRVNNLDAATYVGPVGQMWYDTDTGVLRLGDDVTPGGTIVGGGGGNGSPGTPTNSLQFNSGGTFAGDANLLYNNSTATLSLTGQMVVGVVTATGNVSAQYFLGNGALLTGIAGSYGNSDVSNYLASGTDTANIITTGNIQGSYILGNGSQLTGIAANYSNANVAAYLPTYSGALTAATVTATGNIQGSFIKGNGAFLTGIIATANYSNANVAAYLPTYAGVVAASSVSATGNVQGSYIKGDGSLLTNLPSGNYSNANVAAYLPTYSGNVTAGNVSASGFVYGNGAFLTGVATGSYANSNVAAYLSSGTVSTNIETTAVVQAATVRATTVTATGTVFGASVSSAGAVAAASVSATGQVTGNNVVALGQVSAIGNVTAQNFIGNGAALTGIPTGQVLITSNITSLTAGQSLNIESIYGNAQYPGGIFNFYQAAAPRPTITMTNTWSSTGTTSKNAYANFAGNVVNTSSVLLNLSISSPATFAIQSSDDITIGSTVITGSDITGLGITGNGGAYTISSALIGNTVSTASSSTVTANLSTSAGNGIATTGTTLTTVAPIPFSLGNISANFANTSITPGLGNSQPMNYSVTTGTGTVLTGNIIISGAANLTTNVGNVLVGSTANINSTAGNFVVTASYLGAGSFGAGNSVANVSANVARVIESTPMFYKSTPDSSNPAFVPTDPNYTADWVPAPGAPGNAQGILTNQYNPTTQFYWLAIPDADFWSYFDGTPGSQPTLYYNYALTGIGIVNSSFEAAYGNGTADFGGSGGVLNIGSVPYVALGFTGFANVESPSNPANVFIYVSTSSTS